MALFPSLRKTMRPSPRALDSHVAPEVKVFAGGYFSDLRSALSAQTGREWTPELAVAEGYERIVWVWKPTGVIAENQSARKIVLRQGDETVEDDPLMRLLNIRANPLETGKVLRKRLSAQILLSPRGAFAEMGLTRGGTPYRIDLLPPGRTRIVPGSGIGPDGRRVDPRDTKSLIDHIEVMEPDGIRCRTVEPENIRWFRDPHPLDPYRGTTPLEAAGLSVELDHFARLYNVTFLRNDGRPGGIVAIDGDASPDTLRDIERKFDKGPAAAGKISVVTAEGLQFIDPAGKPRDMSYAQLARNAKIELLSSFGVSESMMGYSGDKTFANAEQERLGFWQDTMPPHLSIITDGINEDSDDDVEPEFDLSDVEVLQKLKDAKLARAREEVAAGLRSPLSYARMAGIDDVENTIHTRSLYIASGKQPLPINAADAIEMGLGPSEQGAEGQAPAGAPGADPAMAGGPGAADVAAGGPTAAGGGSPEGAVPAGPGAAQAAIGAAQAGNPGAPAGAAAQLLAAASATRATPTQGKVLLRVVGGKSDQAWLSDDADETARDALESAIAAALDDLADGWIERAVARMSSVKSRKNTRHWNPQGDRAVDTRVATKAIDPTYAVDEESWAEEASDAVSGLLVRAAKAAAHRTWSALSDEPGLPLPAGLSERAATVAGEVTSWVTEGARRAAVRLARAINDGDQEGLSMDQLVAGVRSFRSRLTSWAQSIATQAATAGTEGARSAAADEVASGGTVDVTATPAPAPEVEQRWRTRGDDRVRASHAAAHGQKQPIGGLFEVGGFLLRYPGDWLAPPSETRNCRCVINYRSRRTGRYVPNPMPLMEAAL